MAIRRLFPGIIAALLCVAASARAGEKPAPKEGVVLEIEGRYPARLSPDGKTVLYLKRLKGDKKSYAYWAVDADGENYRQVFVSAMDTDYPFTFCFGHGMFSPDGKRFTALTTVNGKGLRDNGLVTMRLCALDGKAKPQGLPSKTGRYLCALFAADGSVVFPDGFPKSPKDKEENWSFTLRKVSAEGKVRDILKLDGAVLIALTMNLKRDRVAGVLMTRSAEEAHGRPETRLWVCDLASGKVNSTGRLRLDDYFYYDGGPWPFWSLDGRYVYVNGNIDGEDKRPFSLLRFEPFRKTAEATAKQTALYKKLVAQMGEEDFKARDKATAALRAAGSKTLPVLREAAESKDVEIRNRAERLVAVLTGKIEVLAAGESLVALCELAPGKLSVADMKAKKCYVLDAASGKKTECAEPLLLIDRSGSTGLFMNLKTSKLHVAKIEVKP